MINPKIGECLDCEPGVKSHIMAKRCITGPHFHYQKHQKAKYQKKQAEKAKKQAATTTGITLGRWFNDQISIMPSACENCPEPLNKFAPWSARAYIAHIVPKRRFESVKTHPQNRLFLCIDCHTKFDNSLSREIKQMSCYNLAIQRFKIFMDLIEPGEIKHLQPFLKEVLFSEV